MLDIYFSSWFLGFVLRIKNRKLKTPIFEFRIGADKANKIEAFTAVGNGVIWIRVKNIGKGTIMFEVSKKISFKGK